MLRLHTYQTTFKHTTCVIYYQNAFAKPISYSSATLATAATTLVCLSAACCSHNRCLDSSKWELEQLLILAGSMPGVQLLWHDHVHVVLAPCIGGGGATAVANLHVLVTGVQSGHGHCFGLGEEC